MPSALKNELREVFLDQVRNNKALNEHITIPLPKVGSPRCLLGSCTGRWERCSLPLIKKTWLLVLAFGAGLPFAPTAECRAALGVGRRCYEAPCAHRGGIPKPSFPDGTVPSSRRGWTLEIRVSVIMVTSSLGLGSQHEGSFGCRRHGSEPHRNSRAPAPLR